MDAQRIAHRSSRRAGAGRRPRESGRNGRVPMGWAGIGAAAVLSAVIAGCGHLPNGHRWPLGAADEQVGREARGPQRGVGRASRSARRRDALGNRSDERPGRRSRNLGPRHRPRRAGAKAQRMEPRSGRHSATVALRRFGANGPTARQPTSEFAPLDESRRLDYRGQRRHPVDAMGRRIGRSRFAACRECGAFADGNALRRSRSARLARRASGR